MAVPSEILWVPLAGDLVDDSGNGNDGTAGGTLSYVDGPDGVSNHAVNIDDGEYAHVFDSETVPAAFQNLSDSITLTCWVKPDSLTNNSASAGSYWVMGRTFVELRQEQGSGAHVPFSFGMYNGKLGIGVTDDSTAPAEQVIGGTNLTTDWQFVAATIDGDDIELFLNGNSDGTGTLVDSDGDRSVGSTNSNLVIGARAKDSGVIDDSTYDGAIADVRIYNEVLTPGQIARLANQRYNLGNSLEGMYSAPRISATPAAFDWFWDDLHWMVNPYAEGSGSSTADVVGGNDAAITGASWVQSPWGWALDFSGGNYYAEATWDGNDGLPATLMCLFEAPNVTADQPLVWLGRSAASSDWLALRARGSAAGDPVNAFNHNYGTGSLGNADTTAGYQADTWHVGTAILAGQSERHAYLDGAAKGSDTTTVGGTVQNNDKVALGVFLDSTPTYGDAIIAWAGAWNRVLSDTEIKIASRLLLRDPAIVMQGR